MPEALYWVQRGTQTINPTKLTVYQLSWPIFVAAFFVEKKIRAVSNVNMALNWRGLLPCPVLCRKKTKWPILVALSQKIWSLSNVNMAPNWRGLFASLVLCRKLILPIFVAPFFLTKNTSGFKRQYGPQLTRVVLQSSPLSKTYPADICGSVFCW